ncbi:ATP synthase subunit C lysine N-methyltransferase-like [Dreissena polymorpha]|uniref:Uncharacterized protein n=1 Tax=Dreissena polymorpha TaxID=45954 RepID=A0A9D4CT72_DREPO|nr:ATP synthase subunit C lysine N-methyltransferase-like [Dreissena polymorpha]KAH3730787.1 hypothetical protein DPMN_056784 [Dreissena polymorpha]
MHFKKRESKPISDEECEICRALNEATKNEPRPWDKTSITVVGIFGAFVAGTAALTVSFIAPAFRKVILPYVPATTLQVQNVMKALTGRQGSVLDIGSGDGRVVIEAARHGFHGYGVELNYWLVLFSRYQAWRQGMGHSATFFRKDLWKTDMSKYNNIVIFGVDTLMGGLEKKFEKEITLDTRVLVSRFPLPNWQPVNQVGHGLDAVWTYMRPDHPDYEQSKISKDVVKGNYKKESRSNDNFGFTGNQKQV